LHFLKYFWPDVKVFGKPRGLYANEATLAFFCSWTARARETRLFSKNQPALALFQVWFSIVLIDIPQFYLKLKNEKVEFPFFPLPSLCFVFSLAPTKKQRDGGGKMGNSTFSFFNFKWNWEISIKTIENQTWNKANAGWFFEKSRVSLALAVQLQKKAKVASFA
jgi:hypothetical protein